MKYRPYRSPEGDGGGGAAPAAPSPAAPAPAVPPPAIDMDALRAPDGGYTAPKPVATPQTPNPSPASPSQTAPAGSGQAEAGKGKASDAPSSTPAASGSGFIGAENLASLKARYGDSFQVKDNATPEELAQAIEQAAYSKLHPDARDLQRIIEQGGNMDAFIQERTYFDTMLAKPDKELVSLALRQQYGKSDQNPDGLSDDDISAEVDKLEQQGQLKFRAVELKKGLRQQKTQIEQERATYTSRTAPKEVDTSTAEGLQEFRETVRTEVPKVIKEGKFYGIDMGQAFGADDMNSFVERLLLPDSKTGQSYLQTKLNGNNGMIEAAILFKMADEGVLGSIVQARVNEFKKKVLGGLEQTPPAAGAPASAQGPLTIDYSRLRASEQIIDKEPSYRKK